MEAPSKAAPEGARTPSRRIIYAWALLAAALWVSPALSFAGPATEQIRGTIDRAIEILKDPSLEAYEGEVIRYDKEKVDGPYAEVKTLVVTGKGQEIPVDYRLLGDGGRWRIYDVVIEGISLVNNSRSQFNSILRKSSFDEMMDKLRATIKEQRS